MTDLTADARGVIAETAVLEASPATAWSPETPVRKRRRGLWIGLGAAAVAVLGGAAAVSTVLIAPGTTVAGVAVGGLTPGAAAERIAAEVAATEVTLTGAGTTATITAADLGATVDAQALAEAAHSEHPLWNVGGWNPEPAPFSLTLDLEQSDTTLREAVPSAWSDAVDATVVFDAESATYVTTPAADGTGIDVDALAAALHDALASGETSLSFPATPTSFSPSIEDAEAVAMAEQLTGVVAEAGFYVGEERVVPIEPATAASWISVVAEDGALQVVADTAAIQAVVDGLPEQANRPAVDANVIVNSSGAVLRSIQNGQTGIEIPSTDGIADAFAAQLASGSGAYALEVAETPFTTTEVVRRIEVDLSEQRLWMLENGNVVDTWRISSGKGNTPTKTGTYTIGWKTPSQTMTGYERRGGERFIDPNWRGKTDSRGYAMFEQPNVKWAMYFNGDQAFHGVYWHSNWGTPMSHGCVGMPESRAKQLYEWAPQGLEVTIRR